jgi:hypothetical protein
MMADCSVISNHMRLLSLLSLLSLGAVLAGCDRGEVRGRIAGKVTFQGQPVSEGFVLLNNNDKAIHMTAPLKPDGSYEILTAKGAGLPLATYGVCVTPPPPPPIDIEAKERPTIKQYPNIPQKYRNDQTSGLTLTVKEGTNQLDIDMKP